MYFYVCYVCVFIFAEHLFSANIIYLTQFYSEVNTFITMAFIATLSILVSKILA